MIGDFIFFLSDSEMIHNSHLYFYTGRGLMHALNNNQKNYMPPYYLFGKSFIFPFSFASMIYGMTLTFCRWQVSLQPPPQQHAAVQPLWCPAITGSTQPCSQRWCPYSWKHHTFQYHQTWQVHSNCTVISNFPDQHHWRCVRFINSFYIVLENKSFSLQKFSKINLFVCKSFQKWIF